MNLDANPWKTPRIMPGLSNFDVHVWKACLDQPVERLEHYWKCLSVDERSRADGFVAELHRSRFIVGRAVLRFLLGRYLQIQPQRLAFELGVHGKPALVEEQNPDRIRFNLSHANGLALYAFSVRREIGIDIEFIHAIPDMDRIAARSFSPREYQTWANLPDSEKEMAFFSCWTKKEAFIKAIGNGFFYPLDKFEVAFIPGDRPRLTRVEIDPLAVDQWVYAELLPPPGYAAALISEGKNWELGCYEYQDSPVIDFH